MQAKTASYIRFVSLRAEQSSVSQPPRSSEFPLEHAADLDDSAIRVLVATLRAGKAQR